MKPVLFLFLLLPCLLWGANKTIFLTWDDNPESNITNYVVSLGTSPGEYFFTKNISPANRIALTNETFARASIANLKPTVTYYIAVCAMNSRGMIGDPSNEIAYSPSATKGGMRMILVAQMQNSTNGTSWENLGAPVTNFVSVGSSQ